MTLVNECTEEIEELVRLYLYKVPEEYIKACLYGFRNTSICATTYTKLNKKYLPEKGNGTAVPFILLQSDLKKCNTCKKVLDIDEFSKNSSRNDGLQHDCKLCVRNYRQNNKEKFRKYRADRKALQIQRIPKWITKEELKEMEQFYKNCSKSYHVDHIIPLKGKGVCGLHILSNLQYLTAQENLKKSNKFEIK